MNRTVLLTITMLISSIFIGNCSSSGSNKDPNSQDQIPTPSNPNKIEVNYELGAPVIVVDVLKKDSFPVTPEEMSHVFEVKGNFSLASSESVLLKITDYIVDCPNNGEVSIAMLSVIDLTDSDRPITSVSETIERNLNVDLGTLDAGLYEINLYFKASTACKLTVASGVYKK
ncbi:MAG: hypothetical protein KBD78_01555 [Oligoflexales bacterium]|nr:hypothetical protein [Oligoflexales bacterium]